MRNARSRFRCNVCWEVPGGNFAWACSLRSIIEANARRAACNSFRVKSPASSDSLFIRAYAWRSALRLSRSIACCHVSGASFRCAFSDLLISEASGRSASRNSPVVQFPCIPKPLRMPAGLICPILRCHRSGFPDLKICARGRGWQGRSGWGWARCAWKKMRPGLEPRFPRMGAAERIVGGQEWLATTQRKVSPPMSRRSKARTASPAASSWARRVSGLAWL